MPIRRPLGSMKSTRVCTFGPSSSTRPQTSHASSSSRGLPLSKKGKKAVVRWRCSSMAVPMPYVPQDPASYALNARCEDLCHMCGPRVVRLECPLRGPRPGRSLDSPPGLSGQMVDVPTRTEPLAKPGLDLGQLWRWLSPLSTPPLPSPMSSCRCSPRSSHDDTAPTGNARSCPSKWFWQVPSRRPHAADCRGTCSCRAAGGS